MYGYYQKFTGVERVASLLEEYNGFGIYLSVLFCLNLVLLFKTNGKLVKLFGAVILIMIVVSMLLGKNRGSWIALTLGLLFAALFHRKHINLIKIILPLLLIVVVCYDYILARFAELNTYTADVSNNTFEARLRMWGYMLQVAMKRPIIGYGLGTVRQVSEIHIGAQRVPHNDYVRMFVECGIFSLLSYIMFFLSIWYSFLVRSITENKTWLYFPMFTMINYWIIISITQNLISNVSLYPIFISMIAIADKLTYLDRNVHN
jgi:O-antigen ligase